MRIELRYTITTVVACCILTLAVTAEPQVGPHMAPYQPERGPSNYHSPDNPLESDASLPTADPQRYFEEALDSYAGRIESYKCQFFKQEFFKGKMKNREGVEVLYREEPLSVCMTWFHNMGKIRRASYVKGANIDKEGRDCVLVEPAGKVARLFAPEVKIPVHGKKAKSANRYTMDEFGFRPTLERMVVTNKKAASRGELDLRYIGEGEFDGRSTHIFRRELPYTGEDCEYPDGLLIVHMDQEWQVPVAVYTFTGPDRSQLIGSYELANIELNPKLRDSNFKLAKK